MQRVKYVSEVLVEVSDPDTRQDYAVQNLNAVPETVLYDRLMVTQESANPIAPLQHRKTDRRNSSTSSLVLGFSSGWLLCLWRGPCGVSGAAETVNLMTTAAATCSDGTARAMQIATCMLV
jgi:hypothetical protein